MGGAGWWRVGGCGLAVLGAAGRACRVCIFAAFSWFWRRCPESFPVFLRAPPVPHPPGFFLLGGSAVMEGLLATSVPGAEFQGLGSGEEGLGVPILPKYPKTGGCDPSLPAHRLPQIPQAGEFLQVNTLQAVKRTRAACEETSGLSQ